MKKLLAMLLTLILVVTFAACGGNETPSGNTTTAPPADGGSDTDGTVDRNALTADNWQRGVKELCGLELTLPEGWKFKPDSGLHSIYSYDLRFEPVSGSFDKADFTAFIEDIFTQTAAKSKEGNFNMDASSPYTKRETYNEVPFLELWYIRTDKGYTQVSVSELSALNEINLDLIYMPYASAD